MSAIVDITCLKVKGNMKHTWVNNTYKLWTVYLSQYKVRAYKTLVKTFSGVQKKNMDINAIGSTTAVYVWKKRFINKYTVLGTKQKNKL